MDNRTQSTYPDGKTVRYAYDSANRLSSLTDWKNQVTSLTHDSLGRRTFLHLPNGAETIYGYDPDGRLTELIHETGGG